MNTEDNNDLSNLESLNSNSSEEITEWNRQIAEQQARLSRVAGPPGGVGLLEQMDTVERTVYRPITEQDIREAIQVLDSNSVSDNADLPDVVIEQEPPVVIDVSNSSYTVSGEESSTTSLNNLVSYDYISHEPSGAFRIFIEEAVEKIYPGKWELNEHLVIHFDKITIMNEAEEERDLYDLYIRFTFIRGEKLSPNFEGIRSTLSLDELHSSYCHSHLPGENRNWESFCLGETSMKNTIFFLNVNSFNNNKELWKDMFEGLLYQTESFLRWESISGAPYRYMSKISFLRHNNDLSLSTSELKTSYNRFIKYIKENNWVPNVNPNLSTGEVSLIYDDDLDNVLKRCTPYREYEINNSRQDIRGPIIRNEENFIRRFNPFMFKGKRIGLTVLPLDDEEQIISSRLKTNKKIVEYVQQQFNTAFRRTAIIEHLLSKRERQLDRVRRERESNSEQRNALENIILVQENI